MLRLTDYRVLTLDCYGTLIDWEIGIWDALQPLIMHNGRSDVTRETALRAFAQFENRHEHATPGLRYPELLAQVHRSITESFGLETNVNLDAAFGASVPHWPAFPAPPMRCVFSSGTTSSSFCPTCTATASPASWFRSVKSSPAWAARLSAAFSTFLQILLIRVGSMVPFPVPIGVTIATVQNPTLRVVAWCP